MKPRSGRLREHRISSLYQLGKQLSSLSGEVFLLSAAGKQIAEMLGGEVVIYRPHPGELPRLAIGEGTTIAQHPVSALTAQWVMAHDQIAGAGTDTRHPRRPSASPPTRMANGSWSRWLTRVPDWSPAQRAACSRDFIEPRPVPMRAGEADWDWPSVTGHFKCSHWGAK